jgi:predicted heme/steroid binding protein
MSKNKDSYKIFTLGKLRNYDSKDGKPLYLIFEDKAHQFSQSVKKAAVAFEEARITK